MAGGWARGPDRFEVAGDPADPRGWPVLVRDHLEWLEVTGYSPHSVRTQRVTMTAFAAWTTDRGLAPVEVTRPVLERYRRHLFHQRRADGRPLTFRTQRRRLSELRTFFRWAVRDNRLLFNPASDLDLPRDEQRLPPPVLTAAEVEVVLALPDLDTPVGVRDRAMLETFYATGVRRSELAALDLWDLDRARATLRVRQGKGRRDRLLPVGERALAWLVRWIDHTRPLLVVEPDPAALFLTTEGTRFAPATLTPLVRRYVAAAEVGKSGACHLFRHTMATLMLEGGADIRYVQQMLGHADLNTTTIYTQVAIHKLTAVHAATHPGATLARHRRPDPDHDDHDDEPGREDSHDRVRPATASPLAAEAAAERDAGHQPEHDPHHQEEDDHDHHDHHDDGGAADDGR